MANMLDISFPMGVEFETLYCPACGNSIMSPEQDLTEAALCPHVEWVYIGELGEFVYASPAVQAQIDKLEDEADEDDVDCLIDKLEAVWHEPTKAHIAITTRGMACGPVSSTIQFGLNLLLEEDIEEDAE